MANPGGLPRVTFGIIVLNGEPFTRYCLRSIYPFAHEIIVVEGASPHAAAIATPQGHSTDGTLEVLRHFKAEEDPEGKLKVVTAEDEGHPNGFWPGEKDEQSQAYAKRVTGDWLWQVDIDEFYMPENMRGFLELLRQEPSVAGASFPQITFWGGLSYTADGPFLWSFEVDRVLRFGPGYRYVSHRPPTVLDPAGRDLRTLNWLSPRDTADQGMCMYHYSLLFPRQVREKCAYYGQAFASFRPGLPRWAEECYFRLGHPSRVHNVYEFPSWLERFRGEHPPEVVRMMEDIRAGRVREELRPTDDIETLLGSTRYQLGRTALEAWCRLRHGPMLAPARHALRWLLGPARKLLPRKPGGWR